MGSTEEPERKRRHLHSSVSPPLKKQHSMAPIAEDKKVDASMLQYKNQKLSQQLELQRTEIHGLKEKFDDLKARQSSFDETLIAVNRCWNELVDDIELLSVRAEPGNAAELRVLEPSEPVANDERKSLVPPEQTFLQRLLDAGATESSSSSLGEAIASRKSSTVKALKFLVQNIDLQRAKNDELASLLKNQVAADEAGQLLQKANEDAKTEIQSLRVALDALHLKHKNISSEMRTLEDCRSRDQAEISRLTGELEETCAELETTRRKLAAQKDVSTGPPTPMSSREHGMSSKETRELESCMEEAKILAAQRLVELKEAHEIKLQLSEQIQRFQDSQVEESRIVTSRPYLLLQEQVKHHKAEVDKCQMQMERLQAERDNAYRHEKEVTLRADAGESARRAAGIAESRINELESRLEQCMAERDDLQLRLEELDQLSGRRDTVAELRLMISTLHKEMGMMQTQLNKYRDAAHEVCALRAEIHSLAAVLERKEMEHKSMSKKLLDHSTEALALKEEIRKLKITEQELTLIMDMYERTSSDSREMMDLQQSECRARAQVQRLKEALDEHNLELRVKAAIEAEAACQQRLAAAEAEITEIRQLLDASTREKVELLETIKAKNEEGDAYIAEIETIGQAYEDMQTQNQRLLQQISERDDYNTKLVAEGLKSKQAQAALGTEKQLLLERMQHATSAVELQKQRVLRLEDQVRSYVDQLGKAVEENRHCCSAVDAVKRKMAEAEKENAFLKTTLDATEKQVQDRGSKSLQIQAELEKERFEKKRLEEEVAVLTSKATRLDGGSLVEKLQEDINMYRALLKCGVCHERHKEVVITKCYHLFCNPCIQRNLEIRHRKCPGCGVNFGANDVHPVYI